MATSAHAAPNPESAALKRTPATSGLLSPHLALPTR